MARRKPSDLEGHRAAKGALNSQEGDKWPVDCRVSREHWCQEEAQVSRREPSSQESAEQYGNPSGQTDASSLESLDQLGGAPPSKQGALQCVKGGESRDVAAWKVAVGCHFITVEPLLS